MEADRLEGINEMSKTEAPAKIGRPSTIQASIADFVKRVAAAPESAAALWSAEWSSQKMMERPITTRNVYVSHYRNAIKAALGADHPALTIVKVIDREADPLRTYEPRAYGGRKKTRADRIARFADEVSEALSKANQKPGKIAPKDKAIIENTVRSLWDEELAEMIATLKETTILTTTSAYRNALRSRGIEDDALLAIISPPIDVQKAVTTSYRDRVIEQHHDLVAIPLWEKIREKAIALLPTAPGAWETLDKDARKLAKTISRHRAVEIGIALGVLTGRRPFEIFCQGRVEPAHVPDTNLRGFETWHVLFSGQAKTRGREGTSFDKAFEIPVLAKAKDIIFAWRVLNFSEAGKVWIQMSYAEFKADLLIQPNPQCLYPSLREELFLDLWPTPESGDNPHVLDSKKLKSNNIRALYAEIADNYFRPKSKTKAAFFADILGHTEKDIETASSYMKFYLPDQKSSGPTRRVKQRLSAKIEEAAVIRTHKTPHSA